MSGRCWGCKRRKAGGEGGVTQQRATQWIITTWKTKSRFLCAAAARPHHSSLRIVNLHLQTFFFIFFKAAHSFSPKWPKEKTNAHTRTHTYTHTTVIVVISHSSIIYSHINPPKKKKEKEKERQNANSAPSPQLGVQGCSLVLKKVNPFSFCILICQLYLIVAPTSVKVIVHKHSGNIRGTSASPRPTAW